METIRNWRIYHPGRLFAVLVALGLMSLAVTAFLTARVRLPGEETLAAGYRRNQAVYVPMRDGVEVAVDIWLPPDLRAGMRVPVLLETTRYWPAYRPGWLFRVLVALHLKRPDNLLYPELLYFSRHGFAVIIADARGSGASGGDRITELSPDEITDLGELIDWAARQPWSNGRVGTFGVSYLGNTAELAAVSNHPALRAVATFYNDFDMILGLARLGGVYDVAVISPSEFGKCAVKHGDGNNHRGALGRAIQRLLFGVGNPSHAVDRDAWTVARGGRGVRRVCYVQSLHTSL